MDTKRLDMEDPAFCLASHVPHGLDMFVLLPKRHRVKVGDTVVLVSGVSKNTLNARVLREVNFIKDPKEISGARVFEAGGGTDGGQLEDVQIFAMQRKQ